jgi:hypothetical protein
MILGQSAATAACLAIDANLPLQELPYSQLRDRLVRDGQVLELADPRAVSTHDLPGVVVDDEHAILAGTWTRSTSANPFVGIGYRHDGDESQGLKSARFETQLPAGRYDVRLYFTALPNRSSNTPLRITYHGGEFETTINQRSEPGLEGRCVSVGSFICEGTSSVEVTTTGADGFVIIDAVQWLPVE